MRHAGQGAFCSSRFVGNRACVPRSTRGARRTGFSTTETITTVIVTANTTAMRGTPKRGYFYTILCGANPAPVDPQSTHRLGCAVLPRDEDAKQINRMGSIILLYYRIIV